MGLEKKTTQRKTKRGKKRGKVPLGGAFEGKKGGARKERSTKKGMGRLFGCGVGHKQSEVDFLAPRGAE